MDPRIAKYAELFGGVLANIAELPGGCEHPMLTKSLRQLDEYIGSRMSSQPKRDVIDWLNSKVLDDCLDTKQILLKCCEKGYLQFAIFIYNNEWIESKFRVMTAFTRACKNGHLDILMWLSEHFDKSKITGRIFTTACKNGHVNIAEWIKDSVKNIPNKISNMIDRICVNGHLDMLKWIDRNGLYVDMNVDTVIYIIHNDQLDVVMWILEKQHFEEKQLGKIFALLCERNLEIVKTFDKYTFDKEILNDAFINAFASDTLDVAEYLSTKFDVSDVANSLFSSPNSYEYNLKNIKWLYKFGIKQTTLIAARNDILKCDYGEVAETLEWLVGLGVPINESYIKNAVTMQNTRIVEWLIANKYLKIKKIEEYIKLSCKCLYLKIADVLVKYNLDALKRCYKECLKEVGSNRQQLMLWLTTHLDLKLVCKGENLEQIIEKFDSYTLLTFTDCLEIDAIDEKAVK